MFVVFFFFFFLLINKKWFLFHSLVFGKKFRHLWQEKVSLCFLRIDMNMNVEVEWLVDLFQLFGVIIHGANFNFETAFLLETASEIQTPESVPLAKLKLVSFVAFGDHVLDLLLSKLKYVSWKCNKSRMGWRQIPSCYGKPVEAEWYWCDVWFDPAKLEWPMVGWYSAVRRNCSERQSHWLVRWNRSEH